MVEKVLDYLFYKYFLSIFNILSIILIIEDIDVGRVNECLFLMVLYF